MNTQRLLVDWKALKQLGWSYSRAHTWRLMASNGFPQSFKLGGHRNSHPVWKLKDILNYFETHGLVLTDMDTSL
jgi:predicted DNA-binding transcriptional regulator AlpA